MVESIAAIPRRCGAWLGLLALALQLALSSVHVHDIGQGSGNAVGSSEVKSIVGPAGDHLPAGAPVVPEKDQCQICVGLAVSGTFTVPATTPVILAPVVVPAKLGMPSEIACSLLSPFLPVQPRAPPLTAILA
jgi:hypothetical protein